MFSEESLNEIERAKEKWERENQKALETRATGTTGEGIPVRKLYTPLDLKEKNFDYMKDIGFPGGYPFTRHIDPAGKPYIRGMNCGQSTPEETNRMLKLLRERGNDEPHILFDLPTLQGYDSDEPDIAGDVGKCGSPVDSLEDMEILLDSFNLAQSEATLVDSNPMAIVLFGMHLALAEKQGVSQGQLRGVIQNDAIAGYGSWGTYNFPPDCGLRLAMDVACYCAFNLPRYYPFNIVYHQWAETGATRVQALAFILASGKEYIRGALKRGVDIDAIAPKIGWLGTQYHRDWFAEIAKVRAWRRLWARIVKEEFGAKNPESCAVRIHNAYGNLDLTRDILEMNIVRHALASLGSALAGVQSVGAGATYDEPLGIPSPKAIITGLMDQHLILDETGVRDTIDPLAGSYYVEYLTSEIEDRVREYIKKIEDQGGMVEVIKSGWVFKELAKSAYERQRRLETGEVKLIGMNEFLGQVPEKERIDYYKPNPLAVKHQTDKLNALRAKRDSSQVRRALDKVRAMAEKEESNENNLVPPVFEAVKAYATLGEIRAAFLDVFGDYRTPIGLK